MSGYCKECGNQQCLCEEIKSDREATKIFWKEINNICKGCQKKCKQSAKVRLIKCFEYTKVGEEKR